MAERPVDELTFEAALAELEQIVMRMESSELSLDELLSVYERGAQLARHCGRLLDEAELRVEQLDAGA
jgi:exodeoxyribonuclease VII small subunit